MRTLILAADKRDALEAAKSAGLRKADCSFIAAWSDLTGRATGEQPRIITPGFWDRRDALRVLEALQSTDSQPIHAPEG